MPGDMWLGLGMAALVGLVIGLVPTMWLMNKVKPIVATLAPAHERITQMDAFKAQAKATSTPTLIVLLIIDVVMLLLAASVLFTGPSTQYAYGWVGAILFGFAQLARLLSFFPLLIGKFMDLFHFLISQFQLLLHRLLPQKHQLDRAFFRDQRAANMGDLVTVLVKITDSADLKNDTNATRTGTQGSGLPHFFGMEAAIPHMLVLLRPFLHIGIRTLPP
jgi:fatty acid desaturase